jgi:Domain of unknown function (DUF4158)
VATRDVFSAQELARLRGYGEITRAELVRYFTLTSADEGFLRKFTGPRNVLGASVQLCSLPWLGFVPDEVTAAPVAAVSRLADRLGISAGQLAGYGERAQTRTDHLREIVRYLGWRQADPPGWKELDEFVFARAMEHDSPKLLFHLACEFLISQRVVRPGVVHLLEHVATVRDRARQETWMLLAPQVSDPGRCADLDGLLAVDPAVGRSRLTWLQTGATASSPAAVRTELDKLAFLRGLDAHTLDLSMLPAGRQRLLAGVGRRLTGQALARRFASPPARAPMPASCCKRWRCWPGCMPPGPARSPPVPPRGSCRPAGRATCTPRRNAGMSPPAGTTGNCACCWRCATGCAAGMCSSPARAVTPTPPHSCSPPGSGNPAGMSSATWSASPPAPARRLRQPQPTCTWRWPIWMPSWPPETLTASGCRRTGS